MLPEFKAKSHGQNLAGTFWMQKFLGKKHTEVANRNFLQQNADAIRKKGGCQTNYVIGFIFWFSTAMAWHGIIDISFFLPYKEPKNGATSSPKTKKQEVLWILKNRTTKTCSRDARMKTASITLGTGGSQIEVEIIGSHKDLSLWFCRGQGFDGCFFHGFDGHVS